MTRLHEYQGKAVLDRHGVRAPPGRVARTTEQAADAARELDGPVVLKAQAWVTGRAAKGGIQFAESPQQAAEKAAHLFGLHFGAFPVTEVLVEEAIAIREEFFVSLSIDDAAMAPILLIAHHGGTGIEQRAGDVHRLPVDVCDGVERAAVASIVEASPVSAAIRNELIDAIASVPRIAKAIDARALEINPLVTTEDGAVLAADCRMTIDDYAVFRHPELGIEIARELDHPATDLEKIAYAVEQADHRGTFYFAQLEEGIEAPRRDQGKETRRGMKTQGHETSNARVPTAESSMPRSPDPSVPSLIGFHGAGGGGSMMSMDAVTNEGFTLANFCDTSGNPSAAKVYRAARIILSQPGIVGYFGSGSGVASQEQFWSAYGLAKAFREVNLSIPAVIRLGGNSEDRAVEILEDACRDLPARVEGYKKDDTPAFCARRFAELVKQHPSPSGRGAGGEGAFMHCRRVPAFVRHADAISLPIDGGTVWIDAPNCSVATLERLVEMSNGLLRFHDESQRIEPAMSLEELAKRDSEFIALEIECRRAGMPVVFVDLEIVGLDEYVAGAAADVASLG